MPLLLVPVPAVFVVLAALIAGLGGIAVGLFIAGVIDFTREPEDVLARRDRKAIHHA